jgi:hypothetical protein
MAALLELEVETVEPDADAGLEIGDRDRDWWLAR